MSYQCGQVAGVTGMAILLAGIIELATLISIHIAGRITTR